MSKGSRYKHNKTPLVVEHDFPLTGFVCESAHVTNDSISGGIISTARPELLYPCISQVKSRYETSRKLHRGYNTLVQRVGAIAYRPIFVIRVKVAYTCISTIKHSWWVSMIFHRRNLFASRLKLPMVASAVG